MQRALGFDHRGGGAVDERVGACIHKKTLVCVFLRGGEIVLRRDDGVERGESRARVLRDDDERVVRVPPPHRGGGGDGAATARQHERLRFTTGVLREVSKRRGDLGEIGAQPNLVEVRAEDAFPQRVQANVKARGEQTQEFRRGGMHARHGVDASAGASDHLRGADAEREGAVARAVARAIDADLFAPRRGKAGRERQRSLPDQMHLGVVEPERAREA